MGAANDHQPLDHRGLRDDEYYVGLIDPSELIEVEDIDISLFEFDDDEDTSTP